MSNIYTFISESENLYNHKNYDRPVDTFDFRHDNRISSVSATWMGKKISIPIRIDTSNGGEVTMIQKLAVGKAAVHAGENPNKIIKRAIKNKYGMFNDTDYDI